MSDPTELVLSGGFAAAAAIFVLAAAIKGAFRTPAWFGVIPSPATEPIGEQPPPMPIAGRVAVWPYRPVDLLGAAFIFLVFSSLVLASVRAGNDSEETTLDAGMLVVNIGFQFFMAGIVTAMVLKRVGLVTWLGLRWPSWPWVFLLAPGSVLFMWFISGGLYFSGYLDWMESLGVETTQDAVLLLRETTDPWTLGLMAFAAVVVAPLCEEVVFRGYLYPLMKKYGGIFAATVSSSLIFAAAHGNLTAMLPLLIFGGVLVFLYEKTGSLWAPIAAHFCFNAATVGIHLVARHYDIPIGLVP